MTEENSRWEDIEHLEKRISVLEVQLALMLGGGEKLREPPGRNLPPWFDIEQRGIRVPGKEIHLLSQKEFAFLATLVMKQGQWVWKDELGKLIWTGDFQPASLAHSLQNLAWCLRQRLRGTGYVIENAPRRGYRLREASNEQSAA